ncbi:MAG: hypothetical protein PHG63_00845 [Candidatus Dojkabacteria bacterium]|nr:hypothetical protein [Candidatus Dojkabacteria bacterium]
MEEEGSITPERLTEELNQLLDRAKLSEAEGDLGTMIGVLIAVEERFFQIGVQGYLVELAFVQQVFNRVCGGVIPESWWASLCFRASLSQDEEGYTIIRADPSANTGHGAVRHPETRVYTRKGTLCLYQAHTQLPIHFKPSEIHELSCVARDVIVDTPGPDDVNIT